MTRKYVTYTHEIAPGLLLTVETEERAYFDNGQRFGDEYLQGATLNAFGTEINLLWTWPWRRGSR
jgi:hypothetical protein